MPGMNGTGPLGTGPNGRGLGPCGGGTGGGRRAFGFRRGVGMGWSRRIPFNSPDEELENLEQQKEWIEAQISTLNQKGKSESTDN